MSDWQSREIYYLASEIKGATVTDLGDRQVAIRIFDGVESIGLPAMDTGQAQWTLKAMLAVQRAVQYWEES